ncbi:MAG TPA: hypothetical protein VFL13_01585, partial [Candidatus Baltobacteraceae bacterium]|nr:hypothetical protein [Candidatus Baltobacteraceae bacterium]
EILMVRRSGASHFVPHAYVFPGGTVDESDYADRTLARVRGLDAPSFEAQFRMDDPVDSAGRRALAVAALRELYEEAGVLLACGADGGTVAVDVEPTRAPFTETLERLGAYGDASRLTLFSQWITPPAYPKRYNAHFFLAAAGSDQQAQADAVETHDGVWIAPADALARSERDEFSLVYPTIKHLERLAAFDDLDALLAFARTKSIRTVMPDTPGEARFSLPGDVELTW